MHQLIVDTQLCVGHGRCVELAPKRFELDASGIAIVLVPTVTDDELQEAKELVLCCPSEAIFLRRAPDEPAAERIGGAP